MTQESEDYGDENMFGLIGDVFEWMIDTQVSVAVVVVLLLIGAFRELIAAYAKRHRA